MSQNIYRSHGTWTEQDNYILCILKDRGDSYERISQLMVGRSKQAAQQQVSRLNQEEKFNANYWKAQLQKQGLEVPEVPTFKAMVGVEKKECDPIRIEIDGAYPLTLGKGSQITMPVNDLILEIKVY